MILKAVLYLCMLKKNMLMLKKKMLELLLRISAMSEIILDTCHEKIISIDEDISF